MTERSELIAFRKHTQTWLRDGYACEIRYLIHKNGSTGRNVLLAATIKFGWKLEQGGLGFHTGVSNLIAGVIRLESQPITKLREISDSALNGSIEVNDVLYQAHGGLQ